MEKNVQDRRYIAEIAVFLLLLYGVSFCVYLNGDDFMYGTFAHTGILKNVVDYYFTGNGRFWINVIDSALLWFDRYAFMVILPWIVLSFVVFFAKTVLHIMGDAADRKKEKELIRMGMLLFACLDVMCLRETVFWITGMMNYLFPAVLFLLVYLLFRKFRAGELRGLGLIGYNVLCFLAASSVEQYALMFVGMMTLHHGYDLLTKRRIPAGAWLNYAISLVGLALLILAPGNFQRVDEQQIPNFVSNFWSLLYQNTVHDVAVPYLVMLSMTAAWIGTKAKHPMLRWCMQGTPCVILAVVCTPLANKALFLMVPILLWMIQMTAMFVLSKKQVKSEYLFLAIVGIGSQAMLLVSAVWGFRCMLSMYLVYMLLIGCLLYHAEKEVTMTILSCGIAAALHPVLAVVLGAVFVLFHGRKKGNSVSVIGKTVASAGVLLSMAILIIGYAGNVRVYEENLASTHAPQAQIVTLKELPDDTYSWYLIPLSEFHESYYRRLYGIPEDVQIVYETNEPSEGNESKE